MAGDRVGDIVLEKRSGVQFSTPKNRYRGYITITEIKNNLKRRY